MKFRSMILVLTIAFSTIFVSMLGTSYAYYVATDGTSFEVTTGNIDSGVAVVFSQSQYINVYTGIPISEADIDNYASVSSFTITPDAKVLDNAEVAVNIGVADLSIDSALLVDDFKYNLVCNNGRKNVIDIDGNGTKITSSDIANSYLKLGTLSTISSTFDPDDIYNCTLKVWLQETGENQNALMNKRFRGIIKVNTIFKK